MAHIVAVLNPKGGTGKTTLSINLARAFQKSGSRVLVVDSDPQGTARDWSQASQEHHPEAHFPSVVGLDRPTLDKEIPAIGDAFDLVIVDGAAKLHQMTASALKVADTVLIPVQTSSPDIWSAMDLVEVIKARQSIVAGKPKAAFIVSRQTPGTRLAADIDQALQEHGLPVFAARTCNRVVYMETISGGTTVMDQHPSSPAAQEILAIMEELRLFSNLSF
ncbi:MAG TPA: peptide transporter [Candidatus Competibacteraceae bacterium]|nr:peptide transporter [Candidatus Competibacteraceae bacterium]